MQDLPHVLKSRPNLLEITPSVQFKRILRVQAWRNTLYISISIFMVYVCLFMCLFLMISENTGPIILKFSIWVPLAPT